MIVGKASDNEIWITPLKNVINVNFFQFYSQHQNWRSWSKQVWWNSNKNVLKK